MELLKDLRTGDECAIKIRALKEIAFALGSGRSWQRIILLVGGKRDQNAYSSCSTYTHDF
jgi:hypothetical protein